MSMPPTLGTDREMTMRSSTRPSFFAPVIGIWIISCAIVFVSVLVAPQARGQETGKTGWSPSRPQPLESDGEIVLTFTKTEPGRVTYRTMDGDCSTHPPWVPDPGQPDPPQTADCGRPRAEAPEDYGHVSGEMIFNEAGSRTIRIPIVDDDLDEVDEPFVVRAAEGDGVHEQVWLYTAGVSIIDDDPSHDLEDSPGGTAPLATTAGGRPSSSSAKAIPGSDDGEVQNGSGSELASGELEPGPGFDLVNRGDPKASSEGDGRGGGSPSWLAFGLGTIALGSGGVLWVLRRRRWTWPIAH